MASTNQYGIATPPATGGNSMTNFLQSLSGVLSSQGQATYGTGQQGYGQGQQVFQQGVQDFAPAQQYFENILSGNKAEMDSAIAPEKSDILSQYRARRKQLAATGSRSGGTNEATASSEYGQASDIAKLLQSLRPQAAKESASIAGEKAKLGLGESSAGLAEAGLGLESTSTSLNAALAQRGQNIQQQGQEFGLAETLISSLL